MPVLPTYPGVYVEELPKGVRTLIGVGTSTTVFIGRALRGPLNTPVKIHSFNEFERVFGGLWTESTLSYQIRQYFLNGGSIAVVIRMFNGLPATYTATGTVGTTNALTLTAADPGSWGLRLGARVDRTGAPDADSFTLYIRERASDDPQAPVVREEIFRNVSVNGASPRLVTLVLQNESKLVRVSGTLPNDSPEATVGSDVAFTGGNDSVALTEAIVRGGLVHLDKVEQFNILCLPPLVPDITALAVNIDLGSSTWQTAQGYCQARRAVLLVDPKASWDAVSKVTSSGTGLDSLNIRHENSAFYWPWVVISDPLKGGQPLAIAPCGTVAGVLARTDANRGIWKAPAGTEARLVGVESPLVKVTSEEQGLLNPFGVNVLRSLPAAGNVVWGARTLKGADTLASEWKYLPVRRTALHIEESLFQGLRWAVFEPNNASLWAQIRLAAGGFMQELFRQGAFQGARPTEAYFVKCDNETTTQDDIDRGVVNVVVGFAPLKPAEFVIIKLQQMAGQSAA